MPRERIVLSREKLASAVGDRWSEAELSEAAELLSKADGRFPTGVRTLPSELVRAIQRERLIAAMLAAVSEVGYRSLTVQDVLNRAGISRPTFYEQFADKEDCFLAAFDAAVAGLRRRVETAADEAASHWRDRLRAGLEELLRYIDEEPDAARTVLVEARASSPAGLRRRDELLDGFAGCIDDLVRDELPEPPSAIAAAGVVGGIESVLYARLQKGEMDDLDSLVPSLMYFAVLTYAGHEAAGDELDGATLA
ncbi:MAG TPA: TetR/AcrR family transcriptional regulator [Solirubrobacterales bacterium]|jgi:AcrR family transcriptional regulator|nr:TetR/AcrR family transcriptional regulator [Solirubrobacterales bacterium]